MLSWKTVKYVRRYYSSLSPISSTQKAVLITGCDSGFGKRLALRLNKYGFRVYATVLDTESDGAKQLSAIDVLKKSLIVIKMDVTNDSDVKRAFDIVNEDLNSSGHQLWGVVNNAGVFLCSFIDWGLMDSYRKVCDVNVFGAIRVTRTFLPLIRRSKGRIVNVSSIAAIVGTSVLAHYSLSKAALNAFSDSLRREMSTFGVRVSVIMPSGLKTPLTDSEALRMSVMNEWCDSEERVKQVYDNNTAEMLIKRIDKNLVEQASHNVDLVVDAMSEALMNRHPEACYVVADDWPVWMTIAAFNYIPTTIIDAIVSRFGM